MDKLNHKQQVYTIDVVQLYYFDGRQNVQLVDEDSWTDWISNKTPVIFIKIIQHNEIFGKLQ